MAYRTFDEDDDAPDEEAGRGPLFYIIVAVMLACFGSGTALASRAFGITVGVPAFPWTSLAGSAASVTDKPIGVSDLQALQRQIAVSVQSTERMLAAQQAHQAEIKRLSDQVAALSGKFELLQRPLASAQAAIPAPPPKPVVARPKKPAAVQSTGSVSTGGAPLPPPTSLSR